MRAIASRLIGGGLPVPEKGASRLQEYARLKAVLEQFEINCAIDVGASRGQTGRLLRNLGYRGQIHSFEPKPASFEKLQKVCEGDPGWDCHKFALGRSQGTMVLKLNLESEEMTSLLTLRNSPPGIKHHRVNVVPLDLLFEDLVATITEPRVLLKVDAEGYDLEVVKGAASSLGEVKAVMVEAFVQPIYQQAPHYLEVLGELEKEGFELDHIGFVSRTAQNKLMALNALMVRLD
ncbi:MAG: FkbM family methyltransferase [Anaerolineales bacterium]